MLPHAQLLLCQLRRRFHLPVVQQQAQQGLLQGWSKRVGRVDGRDE